MFQHYQQNIDPEDDRFVQFITQYLKDKDVKDPKAMKYPQLYELIKQGIRAYIKERTISSVRK